MADSDTTGKPGGAAPANAQPGDSAGAQQPLPGKRGKVGSPADGGHGRAGDPAVRGRGQGQRQGFDRQRLDPQDTPPADVRDDENLAGNKDFELGPPRG